jgi:LPS sulfotransferase NodH
MTYSQKRFCVLTTGRAGSTALMKALGKFEDIAVPEVSRQSDETNIEWAERLRREAAQNRD